MQFPVIVVTDPTTYRQDRLQYTAPPTQPHTDRTDYNTLRHRPNHIQTGLITIHCAAASTQHNEHVLLLGIFILRCLYSC